MENQVWFFNREMFSIERRWISSFLRLFSIIFDSQSVKSPRRRKESVTAKFRREFERNDLDSTINWVATFPGHWYHRPRIYLSSTNGQIRWSTALLIRRESAGDFDETDRLFRTTKFDQFVVSSLETGSRVGVFSSFPRRSCGKRKIESRRVRLRLFWNIFIKKQKCEICCFKK